MEEIIYNEVYAILKSMDEKFINMIDEDYIEFIKMNMIPNIEVDLNQEKGLLEQNLHQETFDIIAGINLLYWSKDEELNKLLIEQYYRNENGDTNV